MSAALFRFRSAFAMVAVAAGVGYVRAEESAEHMVGRPQCFSTAVTREKIEAHKLTDPFTCLRAAAEKWGGEPIGARLCRLEEVFIYEIRVLRPDGRLLKIFVDATTGRPHSGRTDN